MSPSDKSPAFGESDYCEELELRWRFQHGRRVPAFVERLVPGDYLWVKVGRYRRRMRVVDKETGEFPSGRYIEVQLRFFPEDAPAVSR
jgi:hypothetical protein